MSDNATATQVAQWVLITGSVYFAPVFVASHQLTSLLFRMAKDYDTVQANPGSKWQWGALFSNIIFVVPACVYAGFCIQDDNVGKISLPVQLLVGTVMGMTIRD